MIPLDNDKAASGSATYTNPVFNGSFADPFVFSSGGSYYAVGTGPCALQDHSVEFPILKSEDLIHWTSLGGALHRPGRPGARYWAPEVAEVDGVFYLYYSVGASDERHELHVATSRWPAGPYHEFATPLLDPGKTKFAIDPSPFRDVDGRWYMFYARDFLDSEDGNRPGTALVVTPMTDMRCLPDGYTVVMRARHDWQRYQANRPIYGETYDWHTLEGPCPVFRDGRYYCLYSGGNWQNESYGIDFVSAESLLGPWTDSNDGPGPRVMQTVPGRVVGPGHNSLVTTTAGEDLIAYHAWDPAMTARRFCLDKLAWAKSGPRACGPTWEPQTLHR